MPEACRAERQLDRVTGVQARFFGVEVWPVGLRILNNGGLLTV
jgi:hypothetical protein